MSLDKAIKYGKEHRKEYRGAKSVDKSCRNHGDDYWEYENRTIQSKREVEKAKHKQKEYEKRNKFDDDERWN